MSGSNKVNVTVDGKTVSIAPGTYGFTDLVGHLGASSKTTSLTVGQPSKASTVNGNDSYQVGGGETFTSHQ
jgi:hypothetical protein